MWNRLWNFKEGKAIGTRRWRWRSVGFILNHVGLFITLVAAMLGSGSMQQLKMTVGRESMGYGPQAIAYDDRSARHEVRDMDFALVLRDFEIEYYAADSLKKDAPPARPKCYTSHISVYVKDGGEMRHWGDTIVQVNHPVRVNDWEIYQYGYDEVSTFLLVRDPWLPAVYVGIYMLIAGAVVMIVQATIRYVRKRRGRKISAVALLFFFGITAYVFIPVMTNKQLMPALQSVWFAPHVLVYMLAYTLLGAAAVMAGWGLIRESRISWGYRDYRGNRVNRGSLSILDTIVHIGTGLFTIGMLFGALWAKEAWGDYWSWDPKETWAGATWVAYLSYIHYRIYFPKSRIIPIVILILSFLLLNMCWWGINFLPSAQATSMHLYNMNT